MPSPDDAARAAATEMRTFLASRRDLFRARLGHDFDRSAFLSYESYLRRVRERIDRRDYSHCRG